MSIAVSFTVTLKASGRQFQVAPGQTVLEAAQQAGLALPYSCRAGVCGSCKATVLAGDCHYPRRPPLALNAAEKAHHDVLLCQAVPRGDLLLEAREVASVRDMPMRRFSARVVEKRRLAPEVVSLALQPQGAPLRWLPGQYIEVLLADGHRRPFSIASAPHQGGRIELHVRHVSGGGFTSRVFESLDVGEALELEGPKGTFVPREDSERPIVLMAGGTGFAPVKTLVEHFMHLGARRPLHLYWGARSGADLYLRALPERWAADCPMLDFHAVVSDADAAQAAGARAGFVHECVLADHPDLSGFDVYMCGPPAMIDAARRAFVAAGLPEHRLYFDSFEYAPEVLTKILDARAGIHGL